MYRAMAQDPAKPTQPALGAEDLGCRVKGREPKPPYDVRPDAAGLVGTRPRQEGMSAFDDVLRLPQWLRPREFGGDGDRPAWKMAVTNLPKTLNFVQAGGSHGVISPVDPAPVQAFLDDLACTQPNWKIHHA
jgi:hypothetical protein